MWNTGIRRSASSQNLRSDDVMMTPNGVIGTTNRKSNLRLPGNIPSWNCLTALIIGQYEMD
jgi:hypothetical protein